jgi:spore germination cell wall hydrolase CwlJ-like protein
VVLWRYYENDFKKTVVKFLMVAVLSVLLIPADLVHAPVPPPTPLIPVPKIKIKRQFQVVGTNEILCLARNIYYEARGEIALGQIAVGLVTLNRVKDSRFPNTICRVVDQKHTFPSGNTVCQFSWVCDNSLSEPRGISWQNSIRIAKMLLDGGFEQYYALLDGAKWFHTTDLDVHGKTRTPVATIGGHVFFK